MFDATKVRRAAETMIKWSSFPEAFAIHVCTTYVRPSIFAQSVKLAIVYCDSKGNRSASRINCFLRIFALRKSSNMTKSETEQYWHRSKTLWRLMPKRWSSYVSNGFCRWVPSANCNRKNCHMQEEHLEDEDTSEGKEFVISNESVIPTPVIYVSTKFPDVISCPPVDTVTLKDDSSNITLIRNKQRSNNDRMPPNIVRKHKNYFECDVCKNGFSRLNPNALFVRKYMLTITFQVCSKIWINTSNTLTRGACCIYAAYVGKCVPTNRRCETICCNTREENSNANRARSSISRNAASICIATSIRILHHQRRKYFRSSQNALPEFSMASSRLPISDIFFRSPKVRVLDMWQELQHKTATQDSYVNTLGLKAAHLRYLHQVIWNRIAAAKPSSCSCT